MAFLEGTCYVLKGCLQCFVGVWHFWRALVVFWRGVVFLGVLAVFWRDMTFGGGAWVWHFWRGDCSVWRGVAFLEGCLQCFGVGVAFLERCLQCFGGA